MRPPKFLFDSFKPHSSLPRVWFDDGDGAAAAAAAMGFGGGATASAPGGPGAGPGTSTGTTTGSFGGQATSGAGGWGGSSSTGGFGGSGTGGFGGGGGTASGGSGASGSAGGGGGAGAGASAGGAAGGAAGGTGARGGTGYSALSVIDALRSQIANALLGSAQASPYDPNAPNQYMPKPYNPYDPANYGGTPAYGPGVAPFNRGGVTNFGSGQGFGLGPGGQGNVGANQSQTVQTIRAGLSNTAQNALNAPRGPTTYQDVYNGLSPDAKAVLQSELAGLSGGMGFPSLYNPAAATASHFGDPNYGPSAPVGPATAATSGAGGVTSAGYGAPSGDPGARGSSAVGTVSTPVHSQVEGPQQQAYAAPGSVGPGGTVVGAPRGYGVPGTNVFGNAPGSVTEGFVGLTPTPSPGMLGPPMTPQYITSPFSQALQQNVTASLTNTGRYGHG